MFNRYRGFNFDYICGRCTEEIVKNLVDNKKIIEKFYLSFANADANGMTTCYHDEIVFEDPAFGVLIGQDAKNMWKMLIERSKGQLKITFTNIKADGDKGSANWIAEYLYSQTGRKVVNKISAKFEFRDGKIIKHTDHFDLWKWSRQALGLPGYLLGWSGFMKGKIRKQANILLKLYGKRVSGKR